MKYYFISGEASGDLHASNLIKALAKHDPELNIRAWGGDMMEEAGAKVVKHYRDLAFMGFIEVLMNLRTILANLRICKEDILEFRPDVLVLIDYPGFNLRIAEWAKQKGIKVLYYISPQIWAWKQSRVHKIKRDVGKMLCILPFEPSFYEKFDHQVDFVGHPLLDAIAHRPEFSEEDRRKSYGLGPKQRPLVVLLPGSRKQEIKAMLPKMLEAVKQRDVDYLIAGAPAQDLTFYESVAGAELPIIFGETYKLLEISDFALVASGTATLETALFNVPEVVCYQGSWISVQIAKSLVKIKYISLVNLVMDRLVVKELIQEEFKVSNLLRELDYGLSAKGSMKMKEDYKHLKEALGGSGASARSAQILFDYAKD